MLVIAHRGASGHAPENTLAAFRRAVSLGATFIETDLQLSRDTRFVAIHDDTVDRTTNGQGKVHDLTLNELRRLDAGSWFGSEFTGERIPTLEDILEFSKKHDVVFYLELKPTGSWGGEHALIGALRSSGEIARTIVISFDSAILEALRKIEPTLMTGLLFEGQMENPIQRAVEIGARQLAVRGDLVTPTLLAEARKHDLQVVCWTVNQPAHMRLLIEAGVAGIMSDYPDRLVAAQIQSNPIIALSSPCRGGALLSSDVYKRIRDRLRVRGQLRKLRQIQLFRPRVRPHPAPLQCSAHFVRLCQTTFKLFTNVFRFCAKQTFTNSRNSSLSMSPSFAVCPGNRSVTSADATSGGGSNASRGISSTSSGREYNCVATDKYP